MNKLFLAVALMVTVPALAVKTPESSPKRSPKRPSLLDLDPTSPKRKRAEERRRKLQFSRPKDAKYGKAAKIAYSRAQRDEVQ